MELLYSDFPPFHKQGKCFGDRFYSLLNEASRLNICVGYASVDSLVDLKKYIESNMSNQPPELNIALGMHFFEGFTVNQAKAAGSLNSYLKKHSLGEIKLANIFPYHGKVYQFKKKESDTLTSILGSSNLKNISGFSDSYEIDLAITEERINEEIVTFFSDFFERGCIALEGANPPIITQRTATLKGHDKVEDISIAKTKEYFSTESEFKFRIPINTDSRNTKSNLNVFFGKGRTDKVNGRVKPRHWYEVEIGVSTGIRRNENFPKSQTTDGGHFFWVITDDGWKFKCQTSGGKGSDEWGKNFRSAYDLKILGRWFKGRLEETGCLIPGELVTSAILNAYGRQDFILRSTSEPDVWLIDFSVA